MAKGFFLLLAASLFFLTQEVVHAQASSTPLLPPRDAAQVPVAPVKALYHIALGEQAHVFNGGEYFGYTLRSKGHQFFQSDVWTDAAITYDGIDYHRIPLLYDIVNEALVVVRPDEKGVPIRIQISADKVSRFTLLGHQFVKISGEKGMPPGFYDVLYQGEVQVLAKRQKSSLKQNAEISFSSEDTFFILKDGKYHQVHNKSSVLKVFSDRKAALAKNLKKHSLDFGQNREAAILIIAQEYDLLTPAQ